MFSYAHYTVYAHKNYADEEYVIFICFLMFIKNYNIFLVKVSVSVISLRASMLYQHLLC